MSMKEITAENLERDAMELAVQLDSYATEDEYLYVDSVESQEDHIEYLKEQLLNGHFDGFKKYLIGDIEEFKSDAQGEFAEKQAYYHELALKAKNLVIDITMFELDWTSREIAKIVWKTFYESKSDYSNMDQLAASLRDVLQDKDEQRFYVLQTQLLYSYADFQRNESPADSSIRVSSYFKPFQDMRKSERLLRPYDDWRNVKVVETNLDDTARRWLQKEKLFDGIYERVCYEEKKERDVGRE